MNKEKLVRVYVGTWKKYNNGSIYGKWLTLNNYSTYDEFLSACRKVHSNEKDPEFMIQDKEGIPDGLDFIDWISKDDFDEIKKVIKFEKENKEKEAFKIINYSEKAIAIVGDTISIKDKLKEMGGRYNPRLTCGAGWIFPKSKKEQLNKILLDYPYNNIANNLLKKTLIEFSESQENSKYYIDEFLGAVKLSQGVYLLPKYKIDNVFYFHDEGPNYDFYKELYNDENKIKDYFISQNVSVYDYLIKDIKEHTTYLEVLKNNRANLIINESYSNRNNLSKATDKDKQELIIALEWAKNNMIKRLNTYLKRYGTSKIHLKTYWADR